MLAELLTTETWYFDGGVGRGDARRHLAPITRVFLPSPSSIEVNARAAPLLLAPAPMAAAASIAAPPPPAETPPPTLIELVCALSKDDRIPSARVVALQLTRGLRATSAACAAAVDAALRPAESSGASLAGAGSPGASAAAVSPERKEALRRKRLAKERQVRMRAPDAPWLHAL